MCVFSGFVEMSLISCLQYCGITNACTALVWWGSNERPGQAEPIFLQEFVFNP